MTTSGGTSSVRRLATVLVLGGFLVLVDASITTVAIPQIVSDLRTTLPSVTWITNGYLLALVAVLPTASWATHRFGAKRVYLAALAMFTLASALAGLSWNIGMLIGLRALQGLGGGLLTPVGQVIALRAVPRDERGRMMSLLGLPIVFGPVLGMPLSGLLVAAASWRWIFLINVPVGIAALVLAVRLIPAVGDRADGAAVSPLDWMGIALLPPGAAMAVLGLTLIGNHGHLDSSSVLVILVGLGLISAFVLRSTRIADPLLDLRLLRVRTVAIGCTTLFCYDAGYFGAATLPSIFIQGVRGDTALLAGLLGVPQALATGLTTQVATRLVDRGGARRIVLTGLATSVAGMGALTVTMSANAPYLAIVAAATVLGLGSGATILPAMAATLRDLDQTATPAGTTVLGLSQQLGASVGTAAVAATLTIALRTALPGSRGGGLGEMVALDPSERARVGAGLASAVGLTYLAPLGMVVVALLLAVADLRRRVPRAKPQRTSSGKFG